MFSLQESIRDIEETLNQQFLNIGLNLSLGTNQTKHSHSANAATVFGNTKEQQRHQPILNVIYENNNSSNNNVESTADHVFSSQLDPFEMDHIALQVRRRYSLH